jgi:catechol 2,3-dioxygenase-like lactoylglutathione lyase family enzyme
MEVPEPPGAGEEDAHSGSLHEDRRFRCRTLRRSQVGREERKALPIRDLRLYRSGMGRETSDEAYVVGLCEEVLGATASRQHRFDWLVGDPGRDGRGRMLPVDAYWPDLGLVLEYRERQHEHATPFFDKPDRLTVSGIHRGEQRRLYDRRREEVLPAHGLRLLVVQTDDLDSDGRGRLRRNRERDRAVLERMLADAGAEERRPLIGASVAARLPAQDLDRARSWYAEHLGLEPVEEHPGALRYVVGGGGFSRVASAERGDGSFPRLAITVPDLDAAVAALRVRGVAVEDRGEGRERAARFRDGEGNLIALGEAAAARS